MNRPVLSAAGCVLVYTAERARSHTVGPAEERIFRALNDAPNWLHPPLWAVMQCGSASAVVVATAAQHRRHHRGALAVAASGVGVWLAGKAIKKDVGRGRPDQHLDEVWLRGRPQSGLGFPSGHAAVSTALAISRTSSTKELAGGLLLAGATGSARMYDGAHLPLDVVGGWALGLLGGLVGRALRGR